MIRLSDHLDPTLDDCGPILRDIIAAEGEGAHFLVDGGPDTVYRFRRREGLSSSRARTLRMTSGSTWESDGAVLRLDGYEDDDAYLCWLLDADADAERITLRNLVLDHRPVRGPTEQSHCIRFYGGQHGVTVEGCRILNSLGGDGVYMGNGTWDFTVEDNHVANHARSAYVIAGYGSSRRDFLIRNNTASQDGSAPSPGRLVDFETKGTTIVQNARIVGNAGPGGIEVALMEGGEVRGNVCGSMAITRTRGVQFEGNRIEYLPTTGYAVKFIRYQQCDFSRNTIITHGKAIHVERHANGGLEWEEKHPEALLTGEGNHVLIRGAAVAPVERSKGRPARDVLEDPSVWEAR